MSTVEWELRDLQGNAEPRLFDVEVTEAVNRFGRYGIAHIDDTDGDRWEEYPRGRGVEFHVSEDGGSTFSRQLSGFVVERRDKDENGAEVLEVEAYSFDHLLRRVTVERDFSGKTISTALEEIIKDFTSVTWNASNVTVVNDETINREFDGDKADAAIAEMATKSANEEFGVNDDLEFFFRPRESSAADRGIDKTQCLAYDIPEQGKEALNELKLFFGEEGNRGAVVVDNGEDKFALQDELGAGSPVVLYDEVTREDIDNEADARNKAEEILTNREATLTGTVTTWGLYDTDPGDVIDVAIEPRGIDDQFRIAELTYRWDETEVTIVEKRGGQDETLVRLTDTLKRVEMREADRSVAPTVFKELDLRGTLSLSVTATRYAYDDDRVFRFGELGQPLGPENVGGEFGDGLETVEEVLNE